MNHPLKQAKISVVSPDVNVFNFTDHMGNFHINIGKLVGNVTLQVESSGHIASRR